MCHSFVVVYIACFTKSAVKYQKTVTKTKKQSQTPQYKKQATQTCSDLSQVQKVNKKANKVFKILETEVNQIIVIYLIKIFFFNSIRKNKMPGRNYL